MLCKDSIGNDLRSYFRGIKAKRKQQLSIPSQIKSYMQMHLLLGGYVREGIV